MSSGTASTASQQPKASRKRGKDVGPDATVKVSIACGACRTRKVKCDGLKPICTRCSSRGFKTCVYEQELKRRGPDKKLHGRRRFYQPQPEESQPHASTSSTVSDASPEVPPASSPLIFDNRSHNVTTPSPSLSPWHQHLDPQLSPWQHSTTVASLGLSDVRSYPSAPPRDYREQFEYSPRPPERLKEEEPEAEYELDTDSFRMDNPDYEQQSPATASHGSHVQHAVTAWVDEIDTQQFSPPTISIGPSMQYLKSTWWDQLLQMYNPNRALASQLIMDDLSYLFRTSGRLLSFFHVPSFYNTFLNPESRDRMQPSIVFGCLALSVFMQSSETNRGKSGREKALMLQSAAQSALESSLAAQWLEPALASAAMILVSFEATPHPLASDDRYMSSLRMLDSVIQFLGFPCLDASSPSASVFPPRLAPAVLNPIREPETVLRVRSPSGLSLSYAASSLPLPSPSTSCMCATLSPGHELSWQGSLSNNETWSSQMIEHEQSRRICWTALRLCSGQIASQVASGQPISQFYVSQSSNFALLFPGEALIESYSSDFTDIPSFMPGKHSVWALYSRSTLLWSFTADTYSSLPAGPERDALALQIRSEVVRIEQALDGHDCNTEGQHNYSGRHYLQYCKVMVATDLRRMWPDLGVGVTAARAKEEANSWVQEMKTYLHLHLFQSNKKMLDNPWSLIFLHTQLIRCLAFWNSDHSLLNALIVGVGLLPPIERMMRLYPSPYSVKLNDTIGRLHVACKVSGISPSALYAGDLLASDSETST